MEHQHAIELNKTQRRTKAKRIQEDTTACHIYYIETYTHTARQTELEQDTKRANTKYMCERTTHSRAKTNTKKAYLKVLKAKKSITRMERKRQKREKKRDEKGKHINETWSSAASGRCQLIFRLIFLCVPRTVFSQLFSIRRVIFFFLLRLASWLADWLLWVWWRIHFRHFFSDFIFIVLCIPFKFSQHTTAPFSWVFRLFVSRFYFAQIENQRTKKQQQSAFSTCLHLICTHCIMATYIRTTYIIFIYFNSHYFGSLLILSLFVSRVYTSSFRLVFRLGFSFAFFSVSSLSSYSAYADVGVFSSSSSSTLEKPAEMEKKT